MRKVRDRVERAPDGAAVALPSAAWRLTPELQMAVEYRLAAEGYSIGISSLSGDYREWRLVLLEGLRVEISVDCHIDPGALKIGVQGERAEQLRSVLSRFQLIPVLQLRIERKVDSLLVRPPRPYARRMTSMAKRIKFSVRRRVSTDCCKIVGEEYWDDGAAWVLCLSTAQKLKIEGVSNSSDEVVVTGFGTDRVRLQQLMDLFD